MSRYSFAEAEPTEDPGLLWASQCGDDFVGAAWIDGAAGISQDCSKFGQVSTPFDRIQQRRFQHREFSTQQDHSQTMSEQNSFLLCQITSLHEAIEIASKTQQVADAPDASPT